MLPVIPRGIRISLSSKQKPSIIDLIPFEVLRLLKKLFFQAAGIDFLLVNCDGKSLMDTDKLSSVCEEVSRNSKKFRDKCLNHILEDIDKHRNSKDVFIYECHAGVKTISLPIFLKNMLIAVMHCGPILESTPDMGNYMHHIHELDIDIKNYFQFISKAPVLESKRISIVIENLNYITALITTLAEQSFEKEENALRLSNAYEDLRKIEEALRESESKYKILTENSLMGIFIIQDEVFKFVNPQFKTMLGYAWDELQNFRPIDIVHSDYKNIVNKTIKMSLKQKDISLGVEIIMLKKGGKSIWCEFRATFITYRGKLAIMGNIIDITERKKSEEALNKSQNEYLTLINHLPMGVILINNNYEIIKINKTQANFFGRDTNSFIGKKCYKEFENKEKPDFDCPGVIALKTGVMSDKEIETMWNGKLCTIRVQAYPVMDENGNVIGFTELSIDRTPKIESERKIAILQNAIEGAKESIVITDPSAYVIYANKATSDIFGYTRDEMIGKQVNLYHGSNRGDEIMSLLIQNSAWSGEFLGKKKSGEVVPIYLLASIIKDQSGIPIGFFGLMEDLSEKQKLQRQLKEAEEKYSVLKSQLKKEMNLEMLIGTGPKIIEIKELIKDIADTDATVLIQGETGTGKELVATLIHQESFRKDKPFIRLNCASLSETLLESELFGHEKGSFTGAIRQKKGKFELANGGTIFLDEIGEISSRMQVAILRVIEKREIQRVGGEKTLSLDVRIIAATNRSLEKAVDDEKFRKDLFYRLNIISITLPPLRERKNDIPVLIHHFLQKYQNKFGKKIESLSPKIFEGLLNYSWPGNIRELENTVERMVVTAKENKILAHYFDNFLIPKFMGKKSCENVEVTNNLSLKEAVNLFERKYIKAMLEEENDNIHNTIRRLKISRSGLYEKLKRL